ncbi:hypothetical protein D3C76_1771000 [compost metagenome]
MVQREQPFSLPGLQIQMLIHQLEQMQLAVLSGQLTAAVKDIHAVGNSGRLPAGYRTGDNMNAELFRQA